EQMFQRRERVVEYPVEVEPLELGVPEDISDIFDFDDETAVIGEQVLHRLDELMRILQMGEDAAGDDDVRAPIPVFDICGAFCIEERAECLQSLVVGDLQDVDGGFDADGGNAQAFERLQQN